VHINQREAGEYTPVFYLKGCFKILNQSTFWLSETPKKLEKGWNEEAISGDCFAPFGLSQ